jgi:hypothetical protein
VLCHPVMVVVMPPLGPCPRPTVPFALEGRQGYDREVESCTLADSDKDLRDILIGEGALERWQWCRAPCHQEDLRRLGQGRALREPAES